MPSAKDKSSVAKQAAENATGFVLGATLAAPQKSFIFVERISVLEEFESQSLSAACKAMCRSRKRLKTNAGDGRNWRFYSGTGSVILIGAIRAEMSSEIICVGYTCPLCKQRVVVLRSSDPPPQNSDLIHSQCKCGYYRPVRISEIQFLEVWRATAA